MKILEDEIDVFDEDKIFQATVITLFIFILAALYITFIDYNIPAIVISLVFGVTSWILSLWGVGVLFAKHILKLNC